MYTDMPQKGDLVDIQWKDGWYVYGIPLYEIHEAIRENPHVVNSTMIKTTPTAYPGNCTVVWTCWLDGNIWSWPDYMIKNTIPRVPDWEV